MLNIYNIIADICSEVISENDETLFVRYSCVSQEAKRQIYSGIYNAFPILSDDRTGATRFLEPDDLTESFFEELICFTEKLRGSRDYFVMIALLQVLDEALKRLLHEKIEEFCRDDFSVVLNTNREITGVGLLPRCSCVWERSNRLAHSYNRLDNFLFNLLLMENSILGELIDKHYFLKRDFFPYFEEDHTLRIAASPLTLESPFRKVYYKDSGVNCFCVDYDAHDYSSDNENIWRKIISAADNRCDIIVFPELLGNPDTVSYIRRKLSLLGGNEQRRMPSLIILPSVYEKHLNTVYILDRSGGILCKQSKQNPYREQRSDGAYLEMIFSNNVVNIMHFEGVGRMAVLICKDFITTKYMEQLMRCFKLNLIIVPSYSTGSYDFRQSFDLCAHDDCNVVWINACAALEDGKESNFKNIGYVRKRIGRNDDESQKLCEMPICPGAFEGKCSHDCIYFETMKGV